MFVSAANKDFAVSRRDPAVGVNARKTAQAVNWLLGSLATACREECC